MTYRETRLIKLIAAIHPIKEITIILPKKEIDSLQDEINNIPPTDSAIGTYTGIDKSLTGRIGSRWKLDDTAINFLPQESMEELLSEKIE